MVVKSKATVPYMSMSQFRELLGKYGLNESIKLNRAIELAVSASKDQVRDNGSAVLTQHLLPTTASLIEYYAHKRQPADVEILCASLLHDMVEDKLLAPELIRNEFGERVHRIVDEMTKKNGHERVDYNIYENRFRYNSEYYGQIAGSSDDTKLVKAADRLNNIESSLHNPNRDKVRNYIRETREVYLPIFISIPYFHKRMVRALARLESSLDKEGEAVLADTLRA